MVQTAHSYRDAHTALPSRARAYIVYMPALAHQPAPPTSHPPNNTPHTTHEILRSNSQEGGMCWRAVGERYVLTVYAS
jgi:hypothetical protein